MCRHNIGWSLQFVAVLTFEWFTGQSLVGGTGLEMSEKLANVQRQTLKGLQKTWRTVAQEHLSNRKFGFLEEKYKEMRGGSGLLDSTVSCVKM